MIDTIQDIHIEEVDGQFVATIPRVTGVTHDEALTNAQRAIVAAMIEEAEKRKRRKGKDHTVA
jgi:hypothetical protein